MRPYDGSFGREVTIQFQESTKRPQFLVLPNDKSLLAIEQRSGIGLARHHDILAILES